jgi:sensor histidine kinase regulating citrate/malate metabolism
VKIFKKTFSTKGSGRGLGTYSAKLLTEKFLKGRMYFESNADIGTIFYAVYPLTFL